MFNTVPPPPPTSTPPSPWSGVPADDTTSRPRRARRVRRWPWIIGLLVAFAAGGATGWSLQPEPEVITKEVEPADLPERRQQLDQRASQLDTTESELDEQATALDDREAELETQAGELAERATALDEREADLTATEREIEEHTIPGSGVYLVGEDIQPGTYRSESSGCYWARLSGTSGEFSEIIANDNVEGTAYVTIAATDVAFETSRCGDWTRQ